MKSITGKLIAMSFLGVLWISSANSEEGSILIKPKEVKEEVKSTKEKPRKFATLISDPDARWTRETVVWYQNVGDPLDGPRLGMQGNGNGNTGIFFEGGGDVYLRKFDEKLARYFTISASAPGYLDGPLSHARFGSTGYARERASVQSPDGRYLYFTEPDMKYMVRCIDFDKMDVRTVLKDVVAGAAGMTIDSKGSLYLISYSGFQIVTSDGKVEKRVMEFPPNTQGYALSLVMDEKNNRIYAARRDTHVWYWDLNANGKYVEVLNAGNSKATARATCATGSFDGLRLHCPSGLVKGPDPDVNFLYFGGGDDRSFYRLDLDKKYMLRFRPVEGDKNGLFHFGESPGKVGAAIGGWCGPPSGWNEDGDFYLGDWCGGSGGLYFFKRVK